MLASSSPNTRFGIHSSAGGRDLLGRNTSGPVRRLVKRGKLPAEGNAHIIRTKEQNRALQLRVMFAALGNTRANLKPTNTIVTHADGHRTIESHNIVVVVESDTRPRLRPSPLPLDQITKSLPSWRLPPFNEEAVLSARMARTSRLRVCTWNVWFSPHRADERMAALFTAALQEAPDVLCLQEVVPELASSVRSSAALCRLYDISSNEVGSYGCLILARRSLNAAFREVALPTRMGRSLLIADWIDEHSGKSVGLGCCHFESLSNAELRRKQLAVAGSVLESYGHALICGDFNFDWLHRSFFQARPS